MDRREDTIASRPWAVIREDSHNPQGEDGLTTRRAHTRWVDAREDIHGVGLEDKATARRVRDIREDAATAWHRSTLA